MATMITNDCINCGACEPECPNNAISQGETIFVIDPMLCTECVGFHDYEACAAVCPVDCCVTDPNNIETEEALIARARGLHPDTRFDDNFESRFRKGQDPSAAAGAKKDVPARAASAAGNSATEVTSATLPASTAAASAYAEPGVNFVPLPDIDSWDTSGSLLQVQPAACRTGAQLHDRQRHLLSTLQQVHGGARQFELSCPNPTEGFLRQMAKRTKRIPDETRTRAYGVCRRPRQGSSGLRSSPATRTAKNSSATRRHG